MLFSDLNGDGRLDIITAHSNSSVVSVLLASADGSFLPQTSHGLSGNTADINVADSNADGKLDIVTVSGASGASLLLGAGDGSFVPERALSAVRTDRMAMADIDHDGQIDSVMVEESTNVLSIRHSAPQVEPQLQVPVPSNWILLRDVDADGHLDIFAEEGVYPGNGDGTFTTLKAFPSASGAVYRMLGDVDEDGHLDLVGHVVSSFGEHSLAMLLGRGDGTFTLTHSFGARLEAPRDVALGDFNGDAHLDLALLVDRQLEVKLGAGDASFPCVFRFPIHREATHLGAVDIDSDGRTDLLAAAREAHVISVLKSAAIQQSCR